MKSSDLSTQQAEALRRIIGRHVSFYTRLIARMQMLGFEPLDPLMRAATDARNALQDASVAAHYAACKQGVGSNVQG